VEEKYEEKENERNKEEGEGKELKEITIDKVKAKKQIRKKSLFLLCRFCIRRLRYERVRSAWNRMRLESLFTLSLAGMCGGSIYKECFEEQSRKCIYNNLRKKAKVKLSNLTFSFSKVRPRFRWA
jgi:hypothetical protein